MMDKLQKFCVISLTQGGRHADNTVDLQEFMIMPTGAENMEQAIRMCAEVYQFLRIILKQKGLSTAVGDEGGFAPDLSDSESVLEVILEAVKKAGYELCPRSFSLRMFRISPVTTQVIPCSRQYSARYLVILCR